MRSSLPFFFLLFLLNGTGNAGAAEALAGLTLPEVLLRMQDAQRAIKNVHFHFSETVGKGSTAERLDGEVYFQRPYHLRVEQARPQKQTLWSDGERLWLYTPSAGQELTGAWKPWLAQSGFPAPLLSFMGDVAPESWQTRYQLLFGGYDRPLYKVIFKPKGPGELPMTLWISDTTFLPVRGQLQAPTNPVIVDFKGVEINRSTADHGFEPHVPAGTPVVPLPS